MHACSAFSCVHTQTAQSADNRLRKTKRVTHEEDKRAARRVAVIKNQRRRMTFSATQAQSSADDVNITSNNDDDDGNNDENLAYLRRRNQATSITRHRTSTAAETPRLGTTKSSGSQSLKRRHAHTSTADTSASTSQTSECCGYGGFATHAVVLTLT
jgi:hypothetical protein